MNKYNHDDFIKAYNFAEEKHKSQYRKYTGKPYISHLGEVTYLVMQYSQNIRDWIIAILHDCMEDQGVTHTELKEMFGQEIADGVQWLSDMEEGNRATRKALSRERLSKAPANIQTIKVCDLLDNTSSIVEHDPKFAVTYLQEKRLLLEVLTKADKEALKKARDILENADKKLKGE